MDDVRRKITERIQSRGLTYKDVSLRMGKSHSYIQQYLERGIPRKLKEDDRLALAEILDVEETDLGGKQAAKPAPADAIANLDIRAGMGGGGFLEAFADGSGRVADHHVDGHWHMPTAVKAGWRNMPNVYSFAVTGDSMSPTLESGSYVFVDTTPGMPTPPDIYVVDYGDGLMVKRLEPIPHTDKIKVISDSSHYSDYEMDRGQLAIWGRVVAVFLWRG